MTDKKLESPQGVEADKAIPAVLDEVKALQARYVNVEHFPLGSSEDYKAFKNYVLYEYERFPGDPEEIRHKKIIAGQIVNQWILSVQNEEEKVKAFYSEYIQSHSLVSYQDWEDFKTFVLSKYDTSSDLEIRRGEIAKQIVNQWISYAQPREQVAALLENRSIQVDASTLVQNLQRVINFAEHKNTFLVVGGYTVGQIDENGILIGDVSAIFQIPLGPLDVSYKAISGKQDTVPEPIPLQMSSNGVISRLQYQYTDPDPMLRSPAEKSLAERIYTFFIGAIALAGIVMGATVIGLGETSIGSIPQALAKIFGLDKLATLSSFNAWLLTGGILGASLGNFWSLWRSEQPIKWHKSSLSVALQLFPLGLGIFLGNPLLMGIGSAFAIEPLKEGVMSIYTGCMGTRESAKGSVPQFSGSSVGGDTTPTVDIAQNPYSQQPAPVQAPGTLFSSDGAGGAPLYQEPQPPMSPSPPPVEGGRITQAQVEGQVGEQSAAVTSSASL